MPDLLNKLIMMQEELLTSWKKWELEKILWCFTSGEITDPVPKELMVLSVNS
ncbi:hypothetical protein D3C85_974200 [compost metagenome]